MRLPSSSRLGRASALLLLALVTAGGAWSLAAWLRLPGRLPQAADLRAVAARLPGTPAPGDAVLLAPLWAEHFRRWAPEGLRVLALPPDDPDLARLERLWVLVHAAVPRFDADETLAVLSGRFGPPVAEAREGPLRLLRFEPDPPEVRWSLGPGLPQARVRLGDRDCRWRPRGRTAPRWQCPRGEWNYVAAEVRELDYLARECVWAHPVAGAPLRLRFDDVPLGGELVVRAGFIGESALDPSLGPAAVEVTAGTTRARVEVPQAPGFPATRLSLAQAGRGPLELSITAERDGRRHLCLDAWIEAAPAEKGAP